MAYITLPSKGRGYTLHLNLWLIDQSIEGNYSNVGWHRFIDKGSGSGAYSGYLSKCDGLGGYLEVGSYNFASASRLELGSGSFRVYHNPDGSIPAQTHSVSWIDSIGDPSPELGNGTVYETINLPTIPRATQPTVPGGGVEAGAAVTINLPRASGSFTHDVSYKFGTASGMIATGAGTSASWTPPLAILDQIPNSLQGEATITVVTRNGGATVGTKTVQLLVKVPASVVPTVGGINHSEATAQVASKIGAYVQSQTTLALTMTGVAGAYGSTIQTSTLTVAGQAILAGSGTTGPIDASGTVPIVATVVDSRGRTAQKTVNVTVLAYAKPQISAATFRRALSDGTVTEAGTSIRTDATTSVSSLVVDGAQKNTLTWTLKTKPRTSGTWVVQGTWPGTVPTFSTWKGADSVPVNESRDALLTVTDVLGNTRTAQGIVSTSGGVFHITPDGRVGAGKYAEPGRSVDAAGPIFQNNGTPVADAAHQHAAADIVSGALALDRLPLDLRAAQVRNFTPLSGGVDRKWLRLFSIDGINNVSGADFEAILSGVGEFGNPRRSIVFIQAGIRSANQPIVDSWVLDGGVGNPPELFTRRVSDYKYEVWAKLPVWNYSSRLTVLSENRSEILLDSVTTTQPSGLTAAPGTPLNGVAKSASLRTPYYTGLAAYVQTGKLVHVQFDIAKGHSAWAAGAWASDVMVTGLPPNAWGGSVLQEAVTNQGEYGGWQVEINSSGQLTLVSRWIGRTFNGWVKGSGTYVCA